MHPISRKYISDKIFRLLFHEDISIHLKTLAVLAAFGFEYEEVLDVLKNDERFYSSDLVYWSLKPDILSDFANRRLKDIEFIITDIEATGPIFDKDRIIEIGAIKIKNGQTVDEFHSYVNPGITVPWQIYRLTGVKKKQLDEAPEIYPVLQEFKEFWGSGVFCAHHCDFDLYFMNSEINRLQIDFFHTIPEICTLRLAKKLINDVKHYGITSLCQYYDYTLDKQHSAIEDARATAFCFNRIVEQFDATGDKTCMELINVQRKLKGKGLLNREAKRLIYRQRQKLKSS